MKMFVVHESMAGQSIYRSSDDTIRVHDILSMDIACSPSIKRRSVGSIKHMDEREVRRVDVRGSLYDAVAGLTMSFIETFQ